MIYLLGVSGNPFLAKTSLKVTMAIIPAFYLLKKFNMAVSYRTVLIFVFFLGYEIMHAFMYNLDYTFTIVKIFLALLISVVTVDILNTRFILVLTKTMVVLSLISFVFVLLCYVPGLNKFLFNLADKLFPVARDYNGYYTPTFIVFTFHTLYFMGEFDYVRNAGMFWESGAFAVFLNLTLFLYYSSKKIYVLKDLFDRDAMILILALITTTSTTGIIALMLILTFFSFNLKSVLKYLLILVVSISSYLVYSSVDFLGDKISKQLSESGRTNNRFGAFLMDMEHIKKHPILGNSRRIEVIFGTTEFSAKTHRPNGVSTFLRNYGLLYFTVYYALVFFSFRSIYHFYHGKYSFTVPAFGVFLILILSFSENIWDLAFSKALLFLFTPYFVSLQLSTLKPIKPFIFENKLSTPDGKL